MLWERYTGRARQVILHAEDWAIRLNSPHISAEHILLGLLEDDYTIAILKWLIRVDTQRLKTELESQLRAQAPAHLPIGSPTLTLSAKQVLTRAADEARSMGHSHIDAEHLLLGLLTERQGLAANLLAQFGVRYEDVRRAVIGQQVAKETLKAMMMKEELEKFAEDWTQKAIEGEFRPVNFWQKERTQFIVSLMRKEQPNLLLLSNLETATLLVQQFACELVQQTKQFVGHKLPNLLLRLKWDALQSGEARQRFLQQLHSLEPKPVLFVGMTDEIAQWPDLLITIAQRSGFLAIAIAIASSGQWDEFKKRCFPFADTFIVIPVSEPNEEQTLEWLKAHAEVYSRFHNVTVEVSALTAVVQLAEERFAEKPLLATAKSLLDSVCAFASAKLAQQTVTAETVLKFAELL